MAYIINGIRYVPVQVQPPEKEDKDTQTDGLQNNNKKFKQMDYVKWIKMLKGCENQ